MWGIIIQGKLYFKTSMHRVV